MSKADIIILAQALALQIADPVALDSFYDDVAQDIARKYRAFVNIQLIQVSAFNASDPEATAKQTIPPEGVEILCVFYGDKMLDLITNKTLDALNYHHRDSFGETIAYMIDEVSSRSFRLFAPPEAQDDPLIFLSGDPFGKDYPANGLAVAYTEARQTVSSHYNLPVALAILSKEFQRESDHRDTTFAKLCADLSEFMFGALTKDAKSY